MTSRNDTTQGFANLIGIMIITAIGTGACLTLLSIDTASVAMTITEESLVHARANADACREDALLRLRNNEVFDGGSTRSMLVGSCAASTQNTLLPDATRIVAISSTGFAGGTELHQQSTLTISYPPPDELPLFSRVITQEVP